MTASSTKTATAISGVGRSGHVIEDNKDHLRVEIDGESWLAQSAEPLSPGQLIRVIAIDRLVLTVEPMDKSQLEE